MEKKEYLKAVRATYNITDDRLKLYFAEGDRLPADEYKEARKMKIVFYHGQKCFSCTWSPRREDFILRYIDQIEEDDAPDDVESRVGRYQKYAERSEEAAGHARDRLANANTDRQARQAENTADYEIEKARHWQNRIAGAIAHAARMDDPGVIVRRIKKLEKHVRKMEKNIKPGETWLNRWLSYQEPNPEIKKETTPAERVLYYSKFDQLTPYDMTGKLEAGTITAAEAVEIAAEAHRARLAIINRWLEHDARRIEYETAYLEAVGGSADMLKPKPRRKSVAPQDGLTKGQIVYVGYGGQGYQKAKILTLSALSARVDLFERADLMKFDPKGYKVGRRFIKQELPA